MIHGKMEPLLHAAEAPEITAVVQEFFNGLFRNEEMLLVLIACALTVLLVNAIRHSSTDYAWQISIVAGSVAYAVIMIAGSLALDVQIALPMVLIGAAAGCLVGFVLEFFLFGADYTRTEYLEYDDDDYYYYVKAVPKASVATSERSIKKINAEPVKEEKKEDNIVSFSDDVFPEKNEMHTVKMPDMVSENTVSEKPQGLDKIDFEKQLEESLKDL